jgi:predicted transcriptional regulator
MRLPELIDLIAGEVVCGDELLSELTVTECFAADLMSDVLAFSRPGALLITGLSSPQSAHTADVADMVAVLFVSGKRPAESVLDLAREKGIPLLTTRMSMFEVCGRLFAAGLASAVRR